MNSNHPVKELVPVTPRGEATKKKLLGSAEIEFGAKGFAAASVSSITQRADVGQGTFYLYFHSKEEVFATLVREVGAGLCGQLAESEVKAAKAGERVRLIAKLLLDFVASQSGRHRILGESQFVDAAAYRAAQQQIFAAVAAQLPPDFGPDRAAALVGACASAAMQHAQWHGKAVDRGLVEAVVSGF